MDNSETLAKLDTSMLWFQDAYQNGFNRSIQYNYQGFPTSSTRDISYTLLTVMI
jgi:hypothetical protein